MPAGEASLKVEGGKLVRAEVETVEGRIASVTLTGDFFLHPSGAIDAVEEEVEGMSAESTSGDFEVAVSVALGAAGAELTGATPLDVGRVLEEAVGEALD